MIVDITPRLAPHFPIGSDLVSLELVEEAVAPAESDEPVAMAVVRLIVWEERDGLRSIRDIKEQQLYLGWPVLYDDAERVANYFAAFAEVFAEIARPEIVERLMPHDLLITDALKLKRARSRDDFVAALRARSRLGRYLEAGT